MLDEYYEVLNINKNSNFNQIQNAYKQILANFTFEITKAQENEKLILEESLQKITEAFNFFKNRVIKAFYDKTTGSNFNKTKILDKSRIKRLNN